MNDQAEVVETPIEAQETLEVEQTEVVVTDQAESTPEEKVEAPDQDIEAGKEEEKPQAAEKTYSQAEFDEATAKARKKAEAVAERRALKAYAEKLEAMNQKPVEQETKAKAPDGKPTIAQFGDDVEGYVEAVAEWKLQQRDLEVRKYQEAKQQEQVRNKALNVYSEAEKFPEFDRETFDELPITDPMAFAIMDSDIAPKLMAHFSSNAQEAERIASLSPARQAAEIGKLEVKLSETKKVTASKAPEPIKPIGSRGSGASTKVEDMDYDQYIAMRKKQGARWAQ